MPLVSLFFATSIVLAHIVAILAAYLYWQREPEKAQAAAMRPVRALWRATKLAYRIVRWPTTLVASWAILTLQALPFLFLAYSWVMLKKIAGEPASVTVKFT